jgi:hypothetical protein
MKPRLCDGERERRRQGSASIQIFDDPGERAAALDAFERALAPVRPASVRLRALELLVLLLILACVWAACVEF